MKFKAKPKLTPERLRKRLDKEEVSNCSLKFKTVNVGIHNAPVYFEKDEISKLVKMINCTIFPEKKTKVKLEFHCDADFY